MLELEKYSLTNEICHFGSTDLSNINNEENRRVILINEAIALKWLGNEEKSKRIINSLDWSGWGNTYKLAVAVLNKEFQKAYGVMEKIGSNSERIGSIQYRDWPLFNPTWPN